MARYFALMQRTRAALPNVRLIVCEPFMLVVEETMPEKVAHLRARAVLIKESSTRIGAVFVPLQEMLDEACNLAPPEYWAYDGFHPTTAGYYLIAQQWRKIVLSDSNI